MPSVLILMKLGFKYFLSLFLPFVIPLYLFLNRLYLFRNRPVVVVVAPIEPGCPLLHPVSVCVP